MNNGHHYNVIDIGVDAGQKTGLAAKELGTQRWVLLKTVSFWGAIDCLRELDEQFTIRRVVVEDPSQNRPVFRRGVPCAQLLKIAQNVGANKSDAKRLIEYCQRQGWSVVTSRPTKRSLTKLDPETFQRLTGITQRTSEHVRDAVMLIV